MSKIFKTKEESIEALNQFINKFKAISDTEAESMFDDGSDSGSAEQNAAFCAIESKVTSLHREVASYQFECIPDFVTQRIWRETWGSGSPSLPESKWNHAVGYANGLIAYMNSDTQELVVVNVTANGFFAPLNLVDIHDALTGEADRKWPRNTGVKDRNDIVPVFSAPQYNCYYDLNYCGVEPVKNHRYALLEWAHENCGNQFYNVCKCYDDKPESIDKAVKEWGPKYYDHLDGKVSYRFLIVEYMYK